MEQNVFTITNTLKIENNKVIKNYSIKKPEKSM